MTRMYSRRGLLKTAAAAGAGLWLNPGRAGGSPNEKLNVACVGLGNQGNSNLQHVQHENIVALCDVDATRRNAYTDKFPKARRFADFREMFDQMANEIDAVVVTTPNHTHAVVAMHALKRGKHCYCEKPLTHTIHEARALQRVAREQGVVTQMGIQIHAKDNYRRAVELVQSGAIGDVHDVHIWLGKPGGYRRHDYLAERPREAAPIPESLNWDLWVGPAPMRPFHPVYHPHDWHYWWDYGNGTLGNMGCHYMDLAYWALDLKYPETVATAGPDPHPHSTPRWLDCHWTFPARGGRGPVNVHWYHGRHTPDEVLDLGGPDWSAGVLFHGTKGRLAADYERRVLLPEAQFADFTPPPQTIPNATRNHREEWVEACKGNGKTLAHFDYSGPLTETVLLGNVAHRAGTAIEWDAENGAVRNNPAANQYIKTEYREGWTL